MIACVLWKNNTQAARQSSSSRSNSPNILYQPNFIGLSASRKDAVTCEQAFGLTGLCLRFWPQNMDHLPAARRERQKEQLQIDLPNMQTSPMVRQITHDAHINPKNWHAKNDWSPSSPAIIYLPRTDTHTRQEWIIIWSGRNWILKRANQPRSLDLKRAPWSTSRKRCRASNVVKRSLNQNPQSLTSMWQCILTIILGNVFSQ